MKNIFIFIPDTLKTDKVGILEGFSKSTDDHLIFYITNDCILNSSLDCIGYCSENSPELSSGIRKDSTEWIHINYKTNHITINNSMKKECDDKVITVVYDYKTFKNSDVSSFKYQTYGEHFETLLQAVQKNNTSEHNNNNHYRNMSYFMFILILNLILAFIDVFLMFYKKLQDTLDYSTTAVHLHTNASILKWALLKIKRDHKITLNVGNTIVSKLVDFIFGITLLYFILQYEEEFIEFVRNTTESIVYSLEELLNFLMGSPVGLKLNHAFNKTLGSFFLYHISLWRAFLDAASPLLEFSFHLLIIPGFFGLSFQAALISDLIAFSTFHVYCIYVYAARLYGLQMHGLVSLWRLFIGRKYNPLRKRVDSHQYTHHQLFVGTLGFTVLLFLLPTTFLYYAVFTVFRIGLIALNGVLVWLRYILQCLPLYTGILWMMNSFSVKGTIKLTMTSSSTVYATLEAVSLWQSIISSMPNTLTEIPSISWSLLFRSVVTGLLL